MIRGLPQTSVLPESDPAALRETIDRQRAVIEKLCEALEDARDDLMARCDFDNLMPDDTAENIRNADAALEAQQHEPTEQEVIANKKSGLSIRSGHGSDAAMPPASTLAPGADAPPDGEPDFSKIAREWAFIEQRRQTPMHSSAYLVCQEHLTEFAQRMYRLGLAARPKVEDAEVAELVSKLRDSHREPLLSEQHRAADLLERVALERDQARKEVEQCYAKSTCCCGDYIRGHGTYSGHEPVSMYSYALDAAEDRAAKAEAELAKIHKADIQRVKDISRLTIERDAAREALAERKGGE